MLTMFVLVMIKCNNKIILRKYIKIIYEINLSGLNSQSDDNMQQNEETVSVQILKPQ